GVAVVRVDDVADGPHRGGARQVGDGLQADGALGGALRAADGLDGAAVVAEQVGLAGAVGVEAGDPEAALAVAGHAVQVRLGVRYLRLRPACAVPGEHQGDGPALPPVDAADGQRPAGVVDVDVAQVAAGDGGQ